MTSQPFRPSNLQRAAACPPSVWREQGMPDLGDSEIAEEGTNLHAAVERAFRRGDYGGLGDQHRYAVRSCVELLEKHTRGVDPSAIFFEHELPVENHWGEPLFDRTAHMDVLIFQNPRLADLVDWKFGYRVPPYSAAQDLQGLAYAVAVRNFYDGIDSVGFNRFHPRLWDEDRLSGVLYSGQVDYWASLADVIKRIVLASHPGAHAHPGCAQCFYCNAKATCAEFKAWAEPKELQPMDCRELSPHRLGELLEYKERVALLNSMMADIEEVAKAALAQGVAIPGWGLKDGKQRREIPDYTAGREKLSEKMPADALDAATKFSVPDLEAAFKAVTGLKGKKASEAFEGALDGLLVKKQDAPSLCRIAN